MLDLVTVTRIYSLAVVQVLARTMCSPVHKSHSWVNENPHRDDPKQQAIPGNLVTVTSGSHLLHGVPGCYVGFIHLYNSTEQHYIMASLRITVRMTTCTSYNLQRAAIYSASVVPQVREGVSAP